MRLKPLAKIGVKLYNSTNESVKTIRWTTRSASFIGGLNGDTYYIVAQESDLTPPYEYDVTINCSIRDLFDSYFTNESQIDFDDFNNLEFRFLSAENYNAHDNPKVYVDYIVIFNGYKENGYGILGPVEKKEDLSWAFLTVNETVYSDNDIKISLLYCNNQTVIDDYFNITADYVDISSLNNRMNEFHIKFELNRYLNQTPLLDTIKIYISSKFEGNEIRDCGIGTLLYDSTPFIYKNDYISNDIGVYAKENRSDGKISEDFSYSISYNSFSQNDIGLIVENTSAYIENNEFNNRQQYKMSNSSIYFKENTFDTSNYIAYVNNSNAYFVGNEYITDNFNMYLYDSDVTIDTFNYERINKTSINLENSSLILIDTYYEDIDFNFLDNVSNIGCKWTISLFLSDGIYTFNNQYVSIYNNNGERIVYKKTNIAGIFDEEVIIGRTINNTSIKYYNPYKIHITGIEYWDDVIINVNHPIFKQIYPYNDYDGDDLHNDYENSDSIVFTARDLAMNSEHIMDINNEYAIRNVGDMIANKNLYKITAGNYKIIRKWSVS